VTSLPALERIARDASVVLDDARFERFSRFRDLLLDWNQRVNLTAIRDPEGVEIRLFGDSIALIPFIRRIQDSDGLDETRLIDIGSGAGFPGLALAIADPSLDVTLVEATRKKVDFMRLACDEIGIANARPIHGRAEDLAHDPAHREQYAVVTARAVASLPALIEICVPFLLAGGHAIFPKGQDVEQEVATAATALKMLRASIIERAQLTTPGLDSTTLVIARKNAPTPKRYPRQPGLPARRPLGAD
jgi:16S rRNA (guanine527-N7)-methyltransferase